MPVQVRTPTVPSVFFRETSAPRVTVSPAKSATPVFTSFARPASCSAVVRT